MTENHEGKPRRHRRKSIARQLQQALIAAQELDSQPANELTVTKSKLVQTRLVVLAKMQARERFDKLRVLKERLASATSEIERLTGELTSAGSEIERLRAQVAQTRRGQMGFGNLDAKLKQIETEHEQTGGSNV